MANDKLIRPLKDPATGKQVYPIGYTGAVYNKDGLSVDSLIDTLKTSISNAEQSIKNNKSAINLLRGLEGSNFLGIQNTTTNAQQFCTIKGYEIGWALIGTDISSLTAYRITPSSAEQIGDSTYDFTDFDNIKSELDTLDSNVSELNDKVNNIDEQINGKIVSIEIFENIRYNTNGKAIDSRYASTNILTTGVYNLNPLDDSFQYSVYYYISDTECIQWFTWRNGGITITIEQPVVIVFRKMVDSSIVSLSTEDIEYLKSKKPTTTTIVLGLKDAVQKNIEAINNIQDKLNEENSNVDEQINKLEDTVNKIDKHINGGELEINILEKTRYSENGKTTGDARFASTNVLPIGTYHFDALENGVQYAIYYYISDTQCNLYYSMGVTEKNIVINQPFVVTYRKLNGTTTVALTEEDIEYLNTHKPTTDTKIIGIKECVQKNSEDIIAIQKELHPQYDQVVFCDKVNSKYLLEMYFPNITSEWKLTGFTVKEDIIRLNLKKPDGTTVIYGHGSSNDGHGLGKELSEKVIEWIDGNTVIGYFVFYFEGDGYAISSANGYSLNVDKITDINNSPRIKEYLSREENLVLLGDSLFGYSLQNILKFYLKDNTDKKVFNSGFPGCRASLREGLGEDEKWNALTLVKEIDCIAANDYSIMENAISNLSSSYSYFNNRLADLKLVDFSKPTTILINYGNNDMTGGNRIGNLWEKGVTTYDKYTLCGAMNYALTKLLTTYPHIKVIYLTPNWRMLGGSVDPDGGTSGDMVAPYEYTNMNGETFMQFVDAIIENTTRLGVKCLDAFRMGGRTALNFDYYSVDSSHFNIRGYKMFANVLSAIIKTL